jgi:hypothetical protein
MPYALVIVERPTYAWPDGLDFYAREMPSDPDMKEGMRRIEENSWLISLDTNAPALANLIRLSHEAKLRCHTLFFDHKPAFCSS